MCVYDDYSSDENAARLDALQNELGIRVVHIREVLDHPSPNYRWVLNTAQREAIEKGQDLVIIESDVIVKADTIDKLIVESQKSKEKSPIGMVAAVTVNEEGEVNFPYEYARKIQQDGSCSKRFSFSHMSRQLGFENILLISNPVLHKPHSSRPWKQLKYKNPLLYYWRKFTQRRDKI